MPRPPDQNMDDSRALPLGREAFSFPGHQPVDDADPTAPPAHLGAGHGQPGDSRVGGEADRKSTRLNSSHVKNSYAVFCLKKKRMKLDAHFEPYQLVECGPLVNQEVCQ